MRPLILWLSVLGLASCNSTETEITNAGLQGHWVSVGWGQSLSFDIATFRADSVRLIGLTTTNGWKHYALQGDRLRIDSDVVYHLALEGDTLDVTSAGKPEWSTRLVRLSPNPNAPPLDRVSVSTGWCLGECPHFDAVLDSTGTVYRRQYGPDGPLASQVSPDGRIAFERLHALASSLYADTTNRAIGGVIDDQEVALVLRFVDTTQVYAGTTSSFGRLRLLLAEVDDATDTLRFSPAPSEVDYESRAALDLVEY